MNLTVVNLFPIPVARYHIQRDWPSVADLIRRTEPIYHPSLKRTSYGTMVNCLDLPQLLDLKREIQTVIDHYCQTQLFCDPVRIIGSWYTDLGPGQQILAHRHPNCTVSGTVYVTRPLGSQDLQFIDPNNQCRMNERPTRHLTWPIECTEGDLVLFPSWLEHSTRENSLDMQGSRLSISFNAD